MNSEASDVNVEIPSCDFLRFPAAPYILGIQKPESANGSNDPYGLFVGVNMDGKDEFNGVIITPPKEEDIKNNTTVTDEEVMRYSGVDIKFNNQGQLLMKNKPQCHIKNCILGVSKDERYIYLVHYNKDNGSYNKIWTLPGNIFNLLYLDRIPYNYSFRINQNKECTVCKIQIPSYIHDKPVIVADNTVTLNNTQFKCFEGNDNKEVLEKSYFINSNNEHIYFKDIKMNPDENNKYILLKRGDELVGSCDVF